MFRKLHRVVFFAAAFLFVIISGSFAAIFGFDGSKKWMQRDGFTGISRGGVGAPSASGFRKSRGLRMTVF